MSSEIEEEARFHVISETTLKGAKKNLGIVSKQGRRNGRVVVGGAEQLEYTGLTDGNSAEWDRASASGPRSGDPVILWSRPHHSIGRGPGRSITGHVVTGSGTGRPIPSLLAASSSASGHCGRCS
jgi:hypothetical protein